MARQKAFKHLIKYEGFKGFIEYLKRTRQNFALESTGYTKRVEWKGRAFSFVNDEGSGIIFACYNKIKADIEASGIEPGEVPRFNVDYFSVNTYLKNAGLTLPREVLNVDINSAYLKTLLNVGFISKETFDFVSKVDKWTRLRCVGMLAMQKIRMTFVEGQLLPITKEDLKSNPYTRNVYFYTCFKVGEAMSKVAEMLGNDFLFFWVDGVYCEPHVNPKLVTDILSLHGYESKAKVLKGCNFETKKNLLYFAHEVEGSDEPKRFVVPFQDEENRKKLNNYINSLKLKQRYVQSNFTGIKDVAKIANGL